MKHVWTWGGTYIGYIDEERLFAHSGTQAGQLDGDDIYGADGQYLGEVTSDDRLITDLSKRSNTCDAFEPAKVASVLPFINYVGYAMYDGHEDFPGPETF
jgi:hypothetical protein